MCSMPRNPKHDPVPLDSFGARLAIIRQYRGGWNVKRTADVCGLDDQRWRNWEAGTHRPQDYPSVCRQIAEALGISYEWLMLGGPLRSRCLGPLVHA
jgi:transcriptional regulator with XRE-family HTH domain